jgi:hypothetical protein
VEVVDVAQMKADWSGVEFDSVEVHVKGEDMLAFAKAVGEEDPRFCDPDHDDYQAPVTFASKYVGRRMFPKGFPKIGSGMANPTTNASSSFSSKCFTPAATVRFG